MAEAVSVKNTEGKFVCSVCQNRYNEMVLSSCFHTFCTDCLYIQANKTGNDKTYSCPMCKATVTLPESFHGNNKGQQYGDWNTNKSADVNFSNSLCDICTDGKMAVNRCLQCEESFCTDCTNAHLRMKSSRYHGQRVVPIRSKYNAEGADVAKNGARYCPRHRNEEIIVVCKQCGVLLCIVCKLMEHQDHVTRHITEDAWNIRQKLSNLLQSQIGYSENLQMQIRLMEDKKTLYPRELDRELGKVRFQATKLHNAIEKEKSDAENELATHYNEYTVKSARLGDNLKHDYEDYVSLSREAQQLLDNENDVYVVRKGDHVYERLKRIESENSTLSETDHGKPGKKFEAGEIDERQVSNLIGRISLDNDNKRPKVVRIWSSTSSVSNDGHQRYEPNEVHRSASASTVSTHSQGQGRVRTNPQLLGQIWLPFTDGLGYVCGVAPAGDKQVWVTLLDHKYVVLVNQQGTVQKQVDIGEVCEGVTSDGEGGCFVTCPTDKSIKRVTRYGIVTTLVGDLLQDPHGIASLVHFDQRQFSMLQELYVCFTESRGWESDVTSPPSHGCVRMLSFSGSDSGVSFPVRSPVRIAANPDTMMLGVVDHSNGCVMVTDRTGQYVQGLYSGPDDMDEDLFHPLGVCFDGRGCVLFADWHNGKVSVMTPDGNLIGDLITGLDGPQSLAVTDGNILWVGTKLGKIRLYNLSQ